MLAYFQTENEVTHLLGVTLLKNKLHEYYILIPSNQLYIVQPAKQRSFLIEYGKYKIKQFEQTVAAFCSSLALD